MSATAQTLRPPSRTLMFLEGRAIHELGAFLGALPLLSLAPKGDGHPVLVLPGLVASDMSTRPLRSFLKNRGYAVSGWRQGRNLGLRHGVQHAMVDLVHELSDTHGRRISLVGWSLGGLYARQLAKMMPDRVRSVITLGSPFAGHPKATNAWRVYEMASGRRADEEDHAVRRIAGGNAAGADHRDLQPHRRHLRLAGLHGKDLRDVREHRGRKQPLRHGPSPRRRLRRGRSSRPARRRVDAVRSQRLAQHRVSRSEPVIAFAPRRDPSSARLRCLAPLCGRGRSSRRLERALSQIHKTRYALAMPQPLARIIDQLKREPSRTGSIVITVFGDAIVPRGGSVWLGTLLEFFKALDIDSGVVRTAMSRLAADGWLEREKVGRNSFYRLVKKGRQTFDAATKHIYDPQASDWTGRFELLLIGNGRGSRRLARGAQECRLRQPAAGRVGRAIRRSDPGGSSIRDPARSLRRGRQRPTPAQRELAARSHRGRLSEIHEDLRAVARLDRPARAAVGHSTPSPRGSC